MQQIVAACGAEPWHKKLLYEVLRRAYSYRNLTWEQYEEIIAILANGIESSRGRYGAYLLQDGIHGELHPRRGARMIAISNGGAIPDTALFNVILQPENGLQIATLDEHFAVDSSPGDVILLGNASWRVQRIEAAGKVHVEDAHGAPPSVPFWTGEAPQRTDVLSDGVSELRKEISKRTENVSPDHISPTLWRVVSATGWLMEHCGIYEWGAQQLITYIVTGRAVLGAVPSKTTIIAERFFDEGGGMQLILHAPFGGRINKAWGLALRKRFCRGFNFELQAAATDNGINISLAEQHSFPLSDVFQFLTEITTRSLLEQASLAAPVFKTRWRAGRPVEASNCCGTRKRQAHRSTGAAYAFRRSPGERLPASGGVLSKILRATSRIPNHPLVREVMQVSSCRKRWIWMVCWPYCAEFRMEASTASLLILLSHRSLRTNWDQRGKSLCISRRSWTRRTQSTRRVTQPQHSSERSRTARRAGHCSHCDSPIRSAGPIFAITTSCTIC